MGHNLAAVSNFQFPQLFINPSGQYLRNTRSKIYQKKKHFFMCFAVNKNHHHQNPPVFSLKFSSFHPLSESPEASFDEYIQDEARLLRATFSGKSEKLDKDEWRVEMPNFQLLFFKVSPVADVRLKCRSSLSVKDYPIHIPHNISQFLDLQLMRWELNGLGNNFKPQKFTISVNGALYAERKGSNSVLSNNLLLNLHNFAAPSPLDFFAQDFLQPLAEKGLKGMMEETMKEFTENLLLDYSKYKKEKQKQKQKNEVPTN